MGRPERSKGIVGQAGIVEFPMIPPQVNGATLLTLSIRLPLSQFPMIPPQVNGATE